MKKREFFVKLSQILETESVLTGTESLSNIESWDSLAIMSFMAFADAEYGLILAPKDLASCSTVADLFDLVYDRQAAQPARAVT